MLQTSLDSNYSEKVKPPDKKSIKRYIALKKTIQIHLSAKVKFLCYMSFIEAFITRLTEKLKTEQQMTSRTQIQSCGFHLQQNRIGSHDLKKYPADYRKIVSVASHNRAWDWKKRKLKNDFCTQKN